MSDGFYLKDPVFADMVRQAMTLGYAPVAYDGSGSAGGSVEERIAAREEAQAENLERALATAGPDARILVYVGHDHVAEAPLRVPGGGALAWMAARLKARTGIDPLTIDQTTLTEFVGLGGSRALYAGLAARIDEESVTALDADGPVVVGAYAGAVDLQVVHPPLRMVEGRPGWLERMGRRPMAVPDALRPTGGRRLIQAFLADAPPEAVPIDQILIQPGDATAMMLPDLPVRYEVQESSPTPSDDEGEEGA